MKYQLLDNDKVAFTGSFDELIDYLDKRGAEVYDELVDYYLQDSDYGEAQESVNQAISIIDNLSGASVDTSKLYEIVDVDIPRQALEHMVEFNEFNDYSDNLKIVKE